METCFLVIDWMINLLKLFLIIYLLQLTTCSENSASRASIRQVCSFSDVLKYEDGGISSFKLCKSEGDISSTAFGVSQEHEPSIKECTGQQPHIYINEEEFDDTVLMKLINNSPCLNKGNNYHDGVNCYRY